MYFFSTVWNENLRACLQGETVTLVLGLPLQASGLKLALIYKEISQVRVTLSPGSTLQALLTRFVMPDILCNVRKN